MNNFVVRQALKSKENDEIIGYEIMLQSDNDSLYNSTDSMAADTISSFLMQNSEKLFNDKLTFLSFSPTLFFRNIPKMFDPKKLVIQIDDSILVHPLALGMIKKYKNQGYCLAIQDFRFSPKYFSSLDWIDYAKIVIENLDNDQHVTSMKNSVQVLHSFGKKCIAVGVNSKDSYDFAKSVEFDYLEGSYMEDTQLMKISKMEYLDSNFLQLVMAVENDEPDIDMIEEILSRDAALTYAILKMVNSAYFAMRKRISSIRQAILTMGITQLRQWVYLLSFNKGEIDNSSKEILKLSFQRATFASELSGYINDKSIIKTETFMMGMFSTIEYLVEGTMEEILKEIPIPDNVKDALVLKEGILGDLLQLILYYEMADWKSSKALMQKLAIPSNIMAQTYIDCVEEVKEIWNGLESEVV